ncbi:unnamed protein product [Clavelina lepadiformis]|uniref:Sodium/nucleoside cotransporter n=1 Tax=Clavelina lepadiformis TaxID=159417 RepID=A0ABP0FSR5_CLALP
MSANRVHTVKDKVFCEDTSIERSNILKTQKVNSPAYKRKSSPTHLANETEKELSGCSSFIRINDNKALSEHNSPNEKLEYTSDQNQVEIEKFEVMEAKGNSCISYILSPVTTVTTFYSYNKGVIFKLSGILFTIGIVVYTVIACFWNFSRAIPLLVFCSLFVAYIFYAEVQKHFGEAIWKFFRPCYNYLNHYIHLIKLLFIICIPLGLIVWIILEISKKPLRIISCLGYLIFLFGMFYTSKYPKRVVWRPVFLGLFIQICLGVLILRTKVGFLAFRLTGDFVAKFLSYIDVGSKFVFGANFKEHFFAFKVLAIVLYTGAFLSIPYRFGAMQWIISKFAWLMQISLHTTAPESLVAAGNIFVGQSESPLLIRPYFADLTTSEVHAVMTTGMATISGSVLGAFISFGLQPAYLIAACVMDAPCALAISKLVYPETKRSQFLTKEGLKVKQKVHHNVMAAITAGAAQAIPLVLNIAGNLIATLSILAVTNGFLKWFGGLLDYPHFSFEGICSYVLLPVSFLMGVKWDDCFKAAELVGTKIFLNEFIAYGSLGEMIKLRDSGIVPKIQPDTGVVNWVDEHTEAIVTYALCGFANFGSIGILLGSLLSIAPQRQSELVKLVLRALVAAVFTNILNGCVAGFLYIPQPIVCDRMLATTNWTYTEPGRLFECCSSTISSNLNSSVATNCCNSFNWTDTGYTLNCSSLSG